MVERERTVLPPEGVPSGASLLPTVTRRFYLSCLAPQAARLLAAIHPHWGIENSLDWVLGCPLGRSLLPKMSAASAVTMHLKTWPPCAG